MKTLVMFDVKFMILLYITHFTTSFLASES